MLDWHSSYAKKFLGVLKWKCLYNSFHEPFSLRLDYLCLSISNQVRAMLFPDVTRWKAGTRSSPCVAGCVSSDEVSLITASSIVSSMTSLVSTLQSKRASEAGKRLEITQKNASRTNVIYYD